MVAVPPPPGRSATLTCCAPRLRVGQPGQGGRDRRASWAAWSSCCPGRPTCPTSSRTPTRWRATPASKAVAVAAATGWPAVGRRHRARGRRARRRAGRVHGALRRRARRRMPTTGPSCSAALDGVDDRRARFRTVAMVVWPDGREVRGRRRVRRHDRAGRARRARLRLRPGVRARRRRRAHLRRDDRGREARRVAPRAGVPAPSLGAIAATRSRGGRSPGRRRRRRRARRDRRRRGRGRGGRTVGASVTAGRHWRSATSPKATTEPRGHRATRSMSTRNSGCHQLALKSPIINEGLVDAQGGEARRSSSHRRWWTIGLWVWITTMRT